MDAPFPPEINAVPYRDRASAGRWLAKQLESYANNTALLVLGIPRGGVFVAVEIAQVLHAPLDVFVVQKIEQVEGTGTVQEVGAVTSGGICVLDGTVIQDLSPEGSKMENAISAMKERVLAWEQLYRNGRPSLAVEGRTLLLVDDGAASGRILRAAVAALRLQRPASIIVATPVASAAAIAHLKAEADQVICPYVPEPFFSIGLAYERFPRLTEEEVHDCLREARREAYPAVEHDPGPYTDGTRIE